ncbi:MULTISPECIES: chaplin [unclassified Streptomyces]|uniref:chaplin n=1 Tax=unclassified Streptomyces TaxID=2593676 RepID=UPI003450B6B3
MSRITRITAIAALAAGTALGGSSFAFADSGAGGGAVGSPGVISGNVIQVPVHVPINLCGNTIDVVGLLNPAFGNTCLNGHFRHHKFIHHKGGHHGKGGRR